MTKQVQLRRGTTSQNAAFTGAVGELVVDSTLNKLILHDGVTVGGYKIASEAYVTAITGADFGNVVITGNTVSTLGTNENLNIAANGSGTVLIPTLSVTNTITGNISGTALTVRTNTLPNITSVGTLTSLGVTGNVIAGNVTATTINATTVSVAGDLIVGSALRDGYGNVSIDTNNRALEDVNSGLSVDWANRRLWDGAHGFPVMNWSNGNTTLMTTDGNVSIDWSSRQLKDTTGTTTLSWASGLVGNISGSATTASTVTSASQPAITTVGTLTSLGVTGNVTAGLFKGSIIGDVLGNVTGNVSGTSSSVTNAAQPNITSVGTLTNLTVTATINGNISGTSANVITNANLIGDVTSIGNATTLATINANVGTFGSNISIPVVTVNAKGLVTAVSTVSIDDVLSDSITVTGDVTGTGYTGSNVSITVNSVGGETSANIASSVSKQYSAVGAANCSPTTSTTISVPGIASNALVFLQATSTDFSALPVKYVSTVTAGTSFTIIHSNAVGTETFNYLVF